MDIGHLDTLDLIRNQKPNHRPLKFGKFAFKREDLNEMHTTIFIKFSYKRLQLKKNKQINWKIK